MKQTLEQVSTRLAPKQNGVFKPTICAVNGVCTAGGFYFLAYSDIPICSENATFVEPHTSNGLCAVVEPTLLRFKNVPLHCSCAWCCWGLKSGSTPRRPCASTW